MDISFYRILIDFGLVILILLVQLVVYPGFLFYSEKDFKRWHSAYTSRITVIVLPLMLLQLILHSYLSYLNLNALNGLSLSIVLLIWMHTFLIAIPIHRQLDKEIDTIVDRKLLVRTNLWRTVAWGLVFGISLSNYSGGI